MEIRKLLHPNFNMGIPNLIWGSIWKQWSPYQNGDWFQSIPGSVWGFLYWNRYLKLKWTMIYYQLITFNIISVLSMYVRILPSIDSTLLTNSGSMSSIIPQTVPPWRARRCRRHRQQEDWDRKGRKQTTRRSAICPFRIAIAAAPFHNKTNRTCFIVYSIYGDHQR